MVAFLKKNPFLRYQGPMMFWAVALSVQSSIPSSELPEWGILTHDKLLHFLVYVVFSYTVHRGITHQNRFPLLREHSYLSTVILIALYAATDEVHQYFVPGRQCSFLDWVADCVGAIVFVCGHWIAGKVRLGSVSP